MFRRSTFALVALILVAVASSSCATMFAESYQDMRIESEPEGATVTIEGREQGETPLEVQLDPSIDHQVEISKEGYETYELELSGKPQGEWIAMDFVFGVLPLVIDVTTQRWNEFPDPLVSVTLEKREETPDRDASDEEAVARRDERDESRDDEDDAEASREDRTEIPDVDTEGEDAQALFKSGASNYRKGNYARALAYFRAAHRKAPDPVLLYNIAFAETKLGRHTEALESIAKIDDRSELPEGVHTKLGAIESSNHVIERARDAADRPDS